jgi:hypothetical protein
MAGFNFSVNAPRKVSDGIWKPEWLGVGMQKAVLSCLHDFLILTFYFKIIFKNNTSKTLFAHLTFLAAPARVARQDNVAAPRRARHAGTVCLRGLLLSRHMHRRGNVMVPRHVGWRGRRFSNLIYQL